MASRKQKIDTTISALSLNGVLIRQSYVLADLLECNQQLRDVIKAFKPDTKKPAINVP